MIVHILVLTHKGIVFIKLSRDTFDDFLVRKFDLLHLKMSSLIIHKQLPNICHILHYKPQMHNACFIE